MVWPALLPPWKRTTASARSASRSVILPFPSSPHWAPTITIPGIAVGVYEGRGRFGASGRTRRGAKLAPLVLAEQRDQIPADLHQSRDGAAPQPLGELVRHQVRRRHDRPLGLVAGVDDRVELLQHPVSAVLSAEIV